MKLFELFATLSLDTSEFDDGMEDALAQADELGENIGHGLAKALNGLADFGQWAKGAASTLWDFGRDAVEVAAEIEAENQQFAATFNGVEDAANEAFAGVAESTGIVAARLRNVGMAAFSQFRGSGMSASVAMETMTRHMMVAADAAAYYNMSYEDADERLRSFLRGNTEAGDAIGLFTSDLQRNEKAMAMYNLKWKDLNEEQRQMVMLNIAEEIYKATGAWGQASREADSYSNMISNLQETWRQTIGKLGKPLLDNVLPVMSKISDWFEENPELVEKLAEGIGVVADKLGSMLLGLFEYIGNHSDEIIAFLDGVAGFVTLIFETLSGSRDKERNERIAAAAEGIILSQEEIDKWNAFVELDNRYRAASANHADGKMSSEDFGKIQAEYEAAMSSFTDREWLLINKYQEQMRKGIPRHIGYFEIDPNIYAGGYYTGEDGATVPVDAELAPGATDGIQSELNGEKYEVPVFVRLEGENYGQYLLRNIGYAFGIGLNGHATGLDYVPYNDYAARLHEGEAVLTKAEAEAWRRHGLGGGGAPAIDYNLMAEAMLTAFSGVSLQMDKRVVGGLVGPTVSRDIARGARNRRYTG